MRPSSVFGAGKLGGGSLDRLLFFGEGKGVPLPVAGEGRIGEGSGMKGGSRRQRGGFGG